MLLHWKPNLPASALHAADRLLRGQPVADENVRAALAPSAAQLLAEIRGLPGVSAERFLATLASLAAAFDNRRDWAEVALAKTIGPDQAISRVLPLMGRLADLEQALQNALPNLLEQLALRAQPLREQWEARGPGLLAGIGRRTEKGLIASEADVILVYPVSGGGGRAHGLYNTVRIEAVLADSDPNLPEIVRLGWLLAQLDLDLPDDRGHGFRERADFLGGLALLPPVLAAAEEVELARCDLPSLNAALLFWDCLGPTPASADAVAALADKVFVWWKTYQATRPRWSVALAALDRMLS
ncbi:MAG TPA: hypothetical protein VFE24_12675 [Pirellulales bacterium]|jgi:hypothetical protein|nr:hypothetical protein [Pirellulales bacterium]